MAAPGPAHNTAHGAGPPAAMLDTLRDFGSCLLALVTLARRGRPETMHREALHMLQRLIPFDAAWWGEVSPGDGRLPPRNWLHGSIGLSASFAEEWNALAAADRFAETSIAQCGSVLRASSGDGRHPVGSAVELFSQRHGITHAMAITMELPASGLMFFIAIYRRAPASPFRDEEAVIFGEFARHLVQHWRDVLDLLQGAVPGRDWEAYAFAADDGRLVYLGARVGQVLRQADPDWQGTVLPSRVSAWVRQAPCSFTLGSADRLTVVPCGRLLGLVLENRRQGDPLAPRERRAAALYARGHSYREIADQLALSPATVRTYLRNAYAQLGVRNKIALAAALALGPDDGAP